VRSCGDLNELHSGLTSSVKSDAAAGCGRLATVRLFDSTIHNLTLAETCDAIEAMIRARDRCYLVCVKDVALTMRSRDDPFLKAFYDEAPDLSVVDGRGLVLASRLLGQPLAEVVGGPGIYFEMLQRAVTQGYRVYLLGANPSVIEAAVRRLQTRLPSIQVVGWHHGYLNDESTEHVLTAIRASAPNLLFIGISTPIRERFLSKYRGSLPPCVCVPVGGVLDVEAGIVHLAPHRVSRLGLEWLYRALQEPARLLGRYLRTHSRFCVLLLRAMARRALNPGTSPGRQG
jgi:N-acetylglucosaminyldiphosphoundecaprenol N-acetyl-beta-D-mannosaminyltransferase